MEKNIKIAFDTQAYPQGPDINSDPGVMLNLSRREGLVLAEVPELSAAMLYPIGQYVPAALDSAHAMYAFTSTERFSQVGDLSHAQLESVADIVFRHLDSPWTIAGFNNSDDKRGPGSLPNCQSWRTFHLHLVQFPESGNREPLSIDAFREPKGEELKATLWEQMAETSIFSDHQFKVNPSEDTGAFYFLLDRSSKKLPQIIKAWHEFYQTAYPLLKQARPDFFQTASTRPAYETPTYSVGFGYCDENTIIMGVQPHILRRGSLTDPLALEVQRNFSDNASNSTEQSLQNSRALAQKLLG